MANVHMQALAFILVSVGYTVANGGMLYVLVGKLQMNYLVAQVIVSSILGIISYPISGWIFRAKAP